MPDGLATGGAQRGHGCLSQTRVLEAAPGEDHPVFADALGYCHDRAGQTIVQGLGY